MGRTGDGEGRKRGFREPGVILGNESGAEL